MAPRAPTAPRPFALVVDESPEERARIASVLDLREVAYVDAKDGRDALVWLEQALLLPVVIVLAWDMGVVDGRRFLLHRAHRSSWRHVPVIVIASESDEDPDTGGLDVLGVVPRRTGTPRLIALVDEVLRAKA